jgi:hypothetical protein
MGLIQFEQGRIKPTALPQQTLHRTGKIIHLNFRRARELRFGVRSDESVPQIRPALLQAQPRGDPLRQEEPGETWSAVLGITGSIIGRA